MTKEGKVVVDVLLTIEQHRETETYAARIRPLGLTAYGCDKPTAILNCKQLFAQFIDSYRRKGMLEQVLDNSGLEWHWVKDHTTSQPDYEDVGASLSESIDMSIRSILSDMPHQWREATGDDQGNRFLVAA